VERATPKVALSTPEPPQIIYVSVMAFFKRKPMMEKLETELAALRARAETLSSRHAAADAAFLEAKSKLQRHHLEADFDADDKPRVKLEAAVAACAVTRDGLADALAEVQTRIVGAEKAIEAERAAVQRNAAADTLSRELDEIEKSLPDYLAATRRFADAIEAVGHWHFDSSQMGTFARNTQAQIEVAAAFVVEELHRMVNTIRDGGAPIPPRKPEPTSVAPLSAVADPAVVQEPPISYHPLKGALRRSMRRSWPSPISGWWIAPQKIARSQSRCLGSNHVAASRQNVASTRQR
jgi:hypothetical protein